MISISLFMEKPLLSVVHTRVLEHRNRSTSPADLKKTFHERTMTGSEGNLYKHLDQTMRKIDLLVDAELKDFGVGSERLLTEEVLNRNAMKETKNDPAVNRKVQHSQGKNSFGALLKILLLDLTAVPIVIGVQWYSSFLNPISLTLVGGIACATVVFISYKFLRLSNDPWYYFFVLCSFTCVIDAMLALETIRILDGVCDLWLKLAEEHLDTKWGASANLIDATIHYSMYFLMIKKQIEGKPYDNLGLFWCGSIVNSMAVLLLSAFFGPNSMRFGIILNIPYALLPLIYLLQRAMESSVQEQTTNRAASRRLDQVTTFGILFLCGSIGILGIPMITNHYHCFNVFVKMQYYVSMGFTITLINFQTDRTFGKKLMYFAGGMTTHALLSQFLQCAVL